MYKIEIQNFSKTFKNETVLSSISLKLKEKQIHGLIGRNGSGKTVLMKCICGIYSPTEGSIYINGKKVTTSSDLSGVIGLIIENPGYLDGFSGLDNLRFLAALQGISDIAYLKEMLRLVGLDPDNRKPMKKYSMGMKQRFALAQAMMGNPEILILDEPMNGLDNRGVEEMRQILLREKEKGRTILLSSHNREDIAALCDTVTELDHGRIIMSTVQ